LHNYWLPFTDPVRNASAFDPTADTRAACQLATESQLTGQNRYFSG
jgi:hypothetical protein